MRFVYPVLFDGADSVGVSVHASRGASPWSGVNKTDVNCRVDKLISNLSLNTFTSALPFLEGTDSENIYLCQQLLGQTQREAVCVCFHLDHGEDINTASLSVLNSVSGSVCLVSEEVYTCVTCMFVCVCVFRSRSQHTCLFRKFAGDLH